MSESQAIATLYGIGVGTGDPELITLKGLNRLKASPVVAFPAGIGGKPGIAEGIISPWLSPGQIQLPIAFPYVRNEDVLQQAWREAAEAVWPHLERGRDVAFASEGDISFYSTFGYLAATLRQLHPEAKIEAIPGVCSPLAAAADLGVPLTVQHQRLTILPALYTVDRIETALDSAEVVVLMKVSSVYETVWKILERRGLLSRACVVERATHRDRVIYRGLGDRPELRLSYFSLLIVWASPDVEIPPL